MTPIPARSFRAYAAAHPSIVAAAVAGMLVVVVTMYGLAWWAGRVAADVAGGAPLGALARRLAVGLVLMVVLTICASTRDLALARLSAGFAAAIRSAMLRTLVRLPLPAVRAHASGDVVTRIGGDIALLHHALLRSLAIWLPSVATSVALLAATIATSPMLAAVTVLLVVPVLVVTTRTGAQLQRAVRDSQERVAVLGTLVADTMAGVREAKVFRREDAIEARASALSNDVFAQTMREERLALTVPAIVTLVAFVGACGLVLAAAWEFERGAIDAEGLTRFLVLLVMLAGPLQESARSASAVARFRALARRCRQLLDAPIEHDESTASPDASLDGQIRFASARIEYPSTGFTLGPIDLDVRAEETIALVGPSGSGKSTLLELVPRLVATTSGSITFGEPTGRVPSLGAIRGACAYVPQEPYFFDGTVRENLRFASLNASNDDIMAVAGAAHVNDFVRRLPGGYDARLTRGALNLSVGQRQRLAVARAMLVDPRILLLDEPTAALDEESERLLIEALLRFTERRTTLLVTHRPALLTLAHRIVQLRDGHIVAVSEGPRAGPRARVSPIASVVVSG